MACGLSAKHWCQSVCLAFAAALLAGCDNTNVAFCSGSDEFCDDFFDTTFGDDDEPDPADGDATEAALAIANATPKVVASAIAHQTMANLVDANPDLVGLWLTAGTLGKLIDADHVAVTEFLDQNRAWLPGTTMPSRSTVLAQGFSLLAEFAAHKDPALAQAAASRVAGATDAPIGSTGEDSAELAEHIVLGHEPDQCCDALTLAAASAVLCPTATAASTSSGAATRTACGGVRQWLAEDEPAAAR